MNPIRIPVAPSGAIKRARAIVALKPTRYKLGAGGRNPAADNPFTIRDKILGSDCIGFVLWCLGLDRFQEKTFPYYGGWINTDSAIMDATGKQTFFEKIDRPEVGCLVVYPALPDKKRIGHVAIVVEVPAEWDNALKGRERTKALKLVKVIDCAGAKWRRLIGKAVRETTAAASWDKPDAIFARYKHFVPDTVASILENGKVVA